MAIQHRPSRWALVWLLVAVGLSISSTMLDARYRTPNGLRYAVFSPGADIAGTPLARGIVDQPGLSPSDSQSEDQDAQRLTRGAGKRLIQWSGFWYVPQAGSHEVFASGNGSMEVHLDDRLLVTHDGDPGAVASDSIEMEAGFHELEIRFNRPIQRARANVHWAPDGGRPRPLAPEALFPRRYPVESYTRNQRLLTLWRVTIAAWLLTALLLLKPVLAAGNARLRNPVPWLSARTDGLTTWATVAGAFVVLATLFRLEVTELFGGPLARFLSLRSERNLGTWCSGALLLLVALYALDNSSRWLRGRSASTGATSSPSDRRRRNAAIGWGSLAIVVAALSADEIGQFHEYADQIFGWGAWWSILPFAVILLGLTATAFAALWSV